MRLILRLLLTAFAFTTILPMIHGIDFHGNFLAAFFLAMVFGVLLWLVELVAVAMAAVFTISSFGLALLWIIPLWIVGFWMFPAIALMLVADFMPQYFSVAGALPAAEAGFVMLAIGLLTSEFLWPDSSRIAS